MRGRYQAMDRGHLHRLRTGPDRPRPRCENLVEDPEDCGGARGPVGRAEDAARDPGRSRSFFQAFRLANAGIPLDTLDFGILCPCGHHVTPALVPRPSG